HPRRDPAADLGLLDPHDAPAGEGVMSARPRHVARRVLLNAAAVVVIVASLFPVYWMVNTSLLPASAVRSETPHWWPDEFTLRNYERALGDQGLITALLNSVTVTAITLVAALVF